LGREAYLFYALYLLFVLMLTPHNNKIPVDSDPRQPVDPSAPQKTSLYHEIFSKELQE
jgi:hypothetical protein